MGAGSICLTVGCDRVLFWDVLVNVCKKLVYVTFIQMCLVSWQGDQIRFHEEVRQLPFPHQCYSSLALILLLHRCWDEDFIVQKPLKLYIVSN